MKIVIWNIISHAGIILLFFFQSTQVRAVEMEFGENPKCFTMSCPVEVTFKPALPSGDMLKILYDGKLAATVESQEIGITRLVTSVGIHPANTHDIVVQHIDNKGKILNTKKTKAISTSRKRGGWTWKAKPGKHKIKRYKYRANVFRIDFDTEQVMSSHIKKSTIQFDIGSITINMNGRMPENPHFTIITDRDFGEMKIKFKTHVESKTK